MTAVTLHLYDLGADAKVGQANAYMEACGTGAFHGGLEVYGKEYSYGYVPDGSGIFTNEPKGCKAHTYRESIDLGTTSKTEDEVAQIIEDLKLEWPGFEYDLLRKNCCFFSAAFAEKLGADPVPSWVTSLAAAGATVSDGYKKTVELADKATIIAKAKAAEIDEQYNISGTVQKSAKDFMEAAGKFDEEYKIRETAFKSAVKLQTAVLGEAADANGDGEVSFEEMKAYLKKKSEEAQTGVTDAYKKADTDGDGVVSMKETQVACGCNEGCTLQ
mmetsp:Transcript_46636/g.84156  ORF Transcript_46636/g.84156 Transcript_46636/m.84156 type:complete len:273 (+) Transcript_46636:72-890(+)|eukprot:CAMPEP_0197664068 /NCGR_PEP_ID=MMETSP1338-20131121/58410_1 /TAXON_ID=43686 ORGANISM="Pelagodinium beii, Strain RCC1491" /NCGR_SAMPLE_ID=MMETSP1338 /ASSEMBLY_ACC=CAM_ASM_000754 /LENGTH=272 /DNA_ID=CAMNT_0043242631 /DNA_START=69 /DNA_END=887 /DNA_ORIENTATION=-